MALLALATMGASMGMAGGVPYERSEPNFTFKRKEKPRKPNYSLPKDQPKGTQLFEGEIEGEKVSFYYGTEKAKQKKIIKITNELKAFKNIR